MPKTVFDLLTKLSNCTRETPNLYIIASDVLWEAWKQPKPLFPNPKQKTQVPELLERSLPFFRYAFGQIDCGMEPDLIDQAQGYRSGLQYLFDEFQDQSELYEKFLELVEGDNVKSVEEYIRENKDEPRTFKASAISDSERKKIPASHYWWD